MSVDWRPFRLFLILLIYVFVGELGVMRVLDLLQGHSEMNWLEAIVDSTLLTLLCVPFFWYFFVKPLEHALRLESAKAHKIVEMAAEGIVTIDTAGRIQSFNRAAQKIFGYSENEVIGQNVKLLMPQKYRDKHDDFIARYLQTGEAHVIGKTQELEGVRKDGTTFAMELAISEVKIGDTHLFTGMLHDISEQKLALQRIEHLAHFDALTHLPNRSLFYDRLGQAIVIAKRNHSSITLLYMDLDEFKNINDTMGHHVGDLLLVKAAERLRLCVRESDTLARLGGDEFTLILNDTNEREDVTMLAKKLIASFAQPFDLEGRSARIGISIGIARYPEDASAEPGLLIVADKAMYAAKAAGKNSYRFGSDIYERTGYFPVLDSDA